MATHYLPKGVSVMRTSQPTIHRLVTRGAQGGAHATTPQLTGNVAGVTCKVCLSKIAAHPDRYPTWTN